MLTFFNFPTFFSNLVTAFWSSLHLNKPKREAWKLICKDKKVSQTKALSL